MRETALSYILPNCLFHFSARRYLHATMHDYVPGGPIVFHVPGAYNPSTKTIEFGASLAGIAGDCRFKGRDRLECNVFLQGSHLICNNAVLSRMKGNQLIAAAGVV
jgi:hypothetical protein